MAALPFDTIVGRLQWRLAALRFQLAWADYEAQRKSQHWLTQPRVPAGNSDGGQWTSDGASASTRSRLYAAAGLPRIPQQRPPASKERTVIAKAVAIWLAEKGIAAADVVAKSSWLYYAIPYISSYLDAPKSLEELQDAVATPQTGYDVNHIVEQSSAVADGYPRKLVEAPDNLVRLPTMKHWEINAWYQTRSPDFQDMSPRDYLRYKDWDERRRVGLEALVRYGVLKP